MLGMSQAIAFSFDLDKTVTSVIIKGQEIRYSGPEDVSKAFYTFFLYFS
jgi:hypothetical protein